MAKTVSIIGLGALGRTLAYALDLQGYEIYSLFNRTVSKAEALADELNVKVSGSLPKSGGELGEFIFITVSDDAIASVAENLSEELWDLSGKTVAHCSGNETSELLESLTETGAEIAAFHPLQTFNLNSKPRVFQDIYISLEGQEGAVSQLELVAKRLGAHYLHVTPKAKAHLHAAAVMASNYLITLMQLAGDIAEMGGMDHQEARKALQTLVKTTAENGTAENLSDVLSGPIARGDLQTIVKHLDLLEQNEQISTLYKLLGLETVKVAERKGTFSVQQVIQMQNLLK
jgi:predicted short-subunit dehydrogenase-like oxidoreductase (DUF2520 family)